jgi:hypothetical protein
MAVELSKLATKSATWLIGAGVVWVVVGVWFPITAGASPGDCYDDPSSDCVRPGADVNGFFNYRERNGEGVGSVDVRNAALDMAFAICHEYDIGMTNWQIGKSLMSGANAYPMQRAATWSVASVDYVCPEYTSQLGTT